MTKRPTFLVVLLLLLSTLFFALDQDKTIQFFKNYITEYESENAQSPKIIQLKVDLEDLVLYRLYKLQIVGSVEKKESATTMGDLLTVHMKALDDRYFESYEDKIAYSAFLAWVYSHLTGKGYQLGVLNEMPAYSAAFNEYTSSVRKVANNVFKSWILYSLGQIDVEPSGFPKGKLPEPMTYKGVYSLDITIDDLAQKEIASLINDQIIATLAQQIEEISKKEYNVSQQLLSELEERASVALRLLPKDLEQSLKESAKNLFELWILRSLSIIDEAPFYPQELPISTKTVPGFTNPIPLQDDNYKKIVEIIDSTPGLRSRLILNLTFGKRIIDGKDFSPVKLVEADIHRAVSELVAPLMKALGELKNEYSAVFVKNTLKEIHLSWLRLLVYAGLALLIWFFLPSWKKFILDILLILEMGYLVFFSNFNYDIFDLSIYAITVFPVLTFATIILISRLLKPKKRNLLDVIMLIAVVLTFILPVIRLYSEVPEIRMDNFPEFYDSPYYEILKSDLYESPDSLLNIEIRKFTSLISSELTDLKRMIRVVLPNQLNSMAKESGATFSAEGDRLRVNLPSFDEYFSIENNPQYIQAFEDLQKGLKNFTRSSRRNYSRYLSELKTIGKMSEEIVTFGGEKLRVDFENFLQTKLSAKPEYAVALDNIEKAISDELSSEPMPAIIRPYRVSSFMALILGLMLLVSIATISRRAISILIGSIILLTGLIISVTNSDTLNIFVHSGSPALNVNVSTGLNVWFLIVFVGIIVLSIFTVISSYMKGRERV
ncbi:hypothetical protein [Kosmotoga sp.]|uniref:hypothetical protein n=1 Tax=Kosmotoga sp. TaxID=1955248 RepID=UPI0024AB7784|nr:hypothetical protein [Kosmotoga sp.]MDI3523470.1 hypothetical protein [Kosmotoga sp.]MDK2952987.1 hypothetical protein [Kosmotoga sp.]